MISHLGLNLETINVSLNKIEVSVARPGEHVSELWLRVNSNEDDLQDLIHCVKTLEKYNASLQKHAEAAENRS